MMMICRSERGVIMAEKTLICKQCGKEFVRMSSRQIYCSAECRLAKRPFKYIEPKKTNTVAEIAVKAKAEGLSYGQYVSKYMNRSVSECQ